MQDVQLGVIIALLPAFGENDGDNSRDVIWKSFKILLETIASFIVVLGKLEVFKYRRFIVGCGYSFTDLISYIIFQGSVSFL